MSFAESRIGLDVPAKRRLLNRLEGLPPAEWSRIAEAVAPMRGGDLASMWRRGSHRALWVSSMIGGLGVLSRMFFTAGVLRGHGHAPAADTNHAARLRALAKTKDSLWREYYEVSADLLDLAQSRLGDDPIAVEAVAIAGSVVARRHMLTEKDVERALQPLRSVVDVKELLGEPRSPAV